MSVVAHNDVFPQRTEDTEWLRRAGREGWVVLGADKRILRVGVEYDSLVRARVRKFVLTDGGLKADQIAEAFLTAAPEMERRANQLEGPFVLSVTKEGRVGRPSRRTSDGLQVAKDLEPIARRGRRNRARLAQGSARKSR